MASNEQKPQMAPGSSLLNQLREKALVSFAQQTTAHGLVRLTQGSGLRRLIWGLAILGACIGFSLHLSELVQRYLSYPVSTEFSRDGADFEFPTVTLCPRNEFAYSCQAPITNYTVRGTPKCLLWMMIETPVTYYMLDSDNWNASVPQYPFEYYPDAKMSIRILAYRGHLFARAFETVIYCRYKSELCTFENFTVYKDEDRMWCFSFSPSNRSVINIGEGTGLYLVLHLRGGAFLTDEEQINHVSGFRVVLHEHGFKPNMKLGFDAPYGYKTSVQVTAETVTKVNRDGAPCSEELPNVTYTMDYSWPGQLENQSFFGTTDDCVTHLKQEEFIEKCGCISTKLALPSELMDTQRCHDLPEHHQHTYLKYELNEYNMTQYSVWDNETYDFVPFPKYLLQYWELFNGSRERLRCHRKVDQRQQQHGMPVSKCPVRCSNKKYKAEKTITSWPKDVHLAAEILKHYAKDILTRINGTDLPTNRLETLRDHAHASLNYKVNSTPSHVPEEQFISVLDIYPGSTKTSVFTESFAYPLRNLFSDFGGILGLWVGVSIITLLEVLELIFALIQLTSLSLKTSQKRVSGLVDPGCQADVSGSADRSKETAGAELQPHIALPPRPTPPGSGEPQGGDSGKDLVLHQPSWFQRVFF